MLTREKHDCSDYARVRKRNLPHVVDAIVDQFSLLDGVLHRKKTPCSQSAPVVGFLGHGYLYARVAGEVVAVHNIVAMLSTGALIPNGMVCDHIDGNRLNNHESNIRVVTVQVNAHNTKRHLASGAKHVNVAETRGGKYVVSHIVSGQRVYLGTFSTVEEAVKSRNKSFAAHAPEKLASIMRRGEPQPTHWMPLPKAPGVEG